MCALLHVYNKASDTEHVFTCRESYAGEARSMALPMALIWCYPFPVSRSIRLFNDRVKG